MPDQAIDHFDVYAKGLGDPLSIIADPGAAFMEREHGRET